MLYKIKSIIVDDSELSAENQRFASIIFLTLAGVMSFQEYVHVRWLWDYHLSFKPTLISSTLAILMVAPLYLRGILKWSRSIYTTLSLILIMLVFASFIELALGGNDRSGITTAAISAALMLSWLGIKEAAGVCWILALAAGLYSTISNNMAMEFFGFLYIVCGFLGLVFHSKLNPGQLVVGIRNTYQADDSTM